MDKQYEASPRTHMRRKDREVESEAWIESFLECTQWGVLAMSVDGQPFVNTNIFVFDKHKRAIYIHTAKKGRTPFVLGKNPQVCFSVSEMGRLLPADEALEFSVEYAGVTVFGVASAIDDPEESEYGLQLLLDKYAPHLKAGKDYHAITPQEVSRTRVFRIDVEEWSGKRKVADLDFSEAYRFEDVAGIEESWWAE